MKKNHIDNAISFVSKFALPSALFFISLCSILLFWESEYRFYGTLFTIMLFFGLFIFLYHSIVPRLIKNNSLVKLVVYILGFGFAFLILLLALYYPLKNYIPYPFNEEVFKFHYLLGVLGSISLCICMASLGVRLELNTYYISKDGYELLQKSYQSEISALKTQMNPHFISNSLNNLHRLVKMGEIEKAKEYNSELIELIHHQLGHTRSEELSLKEELNWLENYLKTEQKRLNFSFSYDIKVEHPPLLDFTIPPMILQPIVENSIKHGFHPDKFEGKGRLEIKINKSHFNSLKITITDNGLGINAPKAVRNRPSISTQSIQERIRLMNEISDINIINKFKQTAHGSVYELKITKGII